MEEPVTLDLASQMPCLVGPVVVEPSSSGRHGLAQPSAISDTPFRYQAWIARRRSANEFDRQSAVAAANDLPVIIQGEPGTGKMLLATLILQGSRHLRQPIRLIGQNGLARLALRSSVALSNPVRGDRTPDSVLMLRNVCGLSLDSQRDLLSIFDCMQLLGPSASRFSKIIVTTTCDLQVRIAEGRFSRELYDRLSCNQLYVPPLRSRKEDILPLCEHFLQATQRHSEPSAIGVPHQFSADAIAILEGHHWPGNVCELIRVVSLAVAMADCVEIGVQHLRQLEMTRHSHYASASNAMWVPIDGGLKQIENHVIHQLLKEQDGNKSEVARLLNVPLRTLYRKLEK